MIEKLIKQNDGSFYDDTGCEWEDRKTWLQCVVMGFCQCGDPDDVMLYIKGLLEKLDRKEWGSYEDMPYMFFMYWANEKEFAEHGTTVRCSSLTVKGEELLKDLRILENELKDKEED